MADAIDGANLVTRLRERCDVGHWSYVMRVTRSAFSLGRRLSGDERGPTLRALAQVDFTSGAVKSTIFCDACHSILI